MENALSAVLRDSILSFICYPTLLGSTFTVFELKLFIPQKKQKQTNFNLSQMLKNVPISLQVQVL